MTLQNEAESQLAVDSAPQPGGVTADLDLEGLADLVVAMMGRLPGIRDPLVMFECRGAQARGDDARVRAPANRVPSRGLRRAVREAERLGVPAVSGAMPGRDGASGASFVAVPLMRHENKEPAAILCAEVQVEDQHGLSGSVELLKLAAGWLHARMAEAERAGADARAALAGSALGAIVTLAEAPRLAETLQSLAIDLKQRFELDRVSIGFVGQRRARVRAISNAPQISRAQPLVRNLAAAMDEALDQDSPLLWQAGTSASGPRITEAHAALAESDDRRAVFTVPMMDRARRIGAVVAERHDGRGFAPGELDVFESVVSMLAPLLEEKRLNDRWLLVKGLASLKGIGVAAVGRRYFAWKAAGLGIGLCFWALVAIDIPHAVKADAVVQGLQERQVSASYSAFIAEAPVREGDRVAEGDLLVQLDDRELALELLGLRTRAEEIRLELARARAEEERAVARILRARLDQVEAEQRLIEERMARMRMTAPFDAVVISGDLSRSIGRSVSEGEPLLTIAPAGQYRIRLSLDQSDVDLVEPGLDGVLRLTARPDTDHAITLSDIVPVAEYGDGRTTFATEARFVEPPAVALYGMEGSARLEMGERPVAAVWFGQIWERLRRWAWGIGLG